MSKKLAKEAFVQGHGGSSAAEITCISTVPALTLLVFVLLAGNKLRAGTPTKFAAEFAVLVLPQIVALMGPVPPSVVFAALLAAALALIARRRPHLKSFDKKLNAQTIR